MEQSADSSKLLSEPSTETRADSKPEADLTTAGVEATARFAVPEGEIERVFVRELPIRAMDSYLVAMNDEEQLIELFCDKPKGWADELTPQSHTEIIERGEEINAPVFDAWFQRRLKRLERLNLGFAKNFSRVFDQAAAATLASSASASLRDTD